MSNFLSNIDLNKNELQNIVLHKAASAPSNPKEGQVYYNTTDKNLYRYNGTSWETYQGKILANGLLQGDGSGNISSVGSVTASDNGKVLTVVNGAWAVASLPLYNGSVS